MSYKERLASLGLTTLLERRARGDLIETVKIVNGIVNYGDGFFRHSRSGRNLSHKLIVISLDLFMQRLVQYWNMLPCEVKDTSSVNDFTACKFRKSQTG